MPSTAAEATASLEPLEADVPSEKSLIKTDCRDQRLVAPLYFPCVQLINSGVLNTPEYCLLEGNNVYFWYGGVLIAVIPVFML